MKKDWSKNGAWRHTKEWYQIKLVDFLKINFPDKIKFNPSVIKITDDKVYFGMQKHYGTLVISKKSLENFDNETISIVKNKTNNYIANKR